MRAFLVCILKLLAGLPGRLTRRAAAGVINAAAGLLAKLSRKEAALRLYARAISMAPAAWRHYYGRASLLFFDLDRAVEALEDVEAALSLKKNSPELYELRAVIYMNRGEHKKALYDLCKLHDDWPGRPETLCLRGLCLMQFDRYTEALADFEADLARDPTWLESIRGKAECLIEIDKFESAAETADWGFKLAPADEGLLTLGVRARLSLGDGEGALQLANRLVPASRCAPYAYSLRADALELVKEPARALKDREQAVKLDPKATGYWNRLALLYGKMEKPRAALKCFNKALKLAPESSVLHLNRGMQLDELDDTVGALADYDAAVRLNDRDADAYYFRARALFDLERTDDSARALALAIKLDDKDPYHFYLRGKIYEKKAELTKAIEDYTRAIELDPKCGPAYERRGAVYFDLGEKAKAREDSQEAKRLRSKS